MGLLHGVLKLRRRSFAAGASRSVLAFSAAAFANRRRRPSAERDNAAVPGGGGGGGSAVAVASRDEDHDNHVVEWNDAPSEASGERQRRGGFSEGCRVLRHCWGRRPLPDQGAFDPDPLLGPRGRRGGGVEIAGDADSESR
ncbi:hypothetical protein ACHAW5_010768 [Stephanodiscus triporus]|uniref:Uncharacterized protein n=1 Tax=Stephanodiscus triporus TaxID=2934178 RepID=A0ABD3NUZ6_9STRA